MKIFVFNIIKPLSKDKRTKLDVRMEFVLAESQVEAEKKIAKRNQDDSWGLCKIQLRNTWEEGEVVNWGFQTWAREDYDSLSYTQNVIDILGSEYKPKLDSYIVKTLKETGKTDEDIKQIALDHREKMISESDYVL